MSIGHNPQPGPSTPGRMTGCKINEDGLKNMRPYRVFKDNIARVNYLDYSRDGRFLITSSDDDSMNVYDCDRAIKTATVNSKKYGVCLVHFADSSKSVIHASSKVDNTIRYLSIENKQYLRYFIGHVKKVHSLSMSPVDDCFLSCSVDNTLRLWDLRAQHSQGTMNGPALLTAGFDRGGLVFGIAVATGHVKLFDIRNYAKGPFSMITMPNGLHTDYASLQFSPNNKLILLATRHADLYLLDSCRGTYKCRLHGHRNDGNLSLKPAFAPASKHVFCGGTDGNITLYNINGDVVKTYHTDHQSPIENVMFNPRYYMLSSACMDMRMWLPTVPDQSSGHDSTSKTDPHSHHPLNSHVSRFRRSKR